MRRIERQPAALPLMSAVNAGERFFYYAFRAHLVLILRERLDLETGRIGEVFAAITLVTVLAALLGGYLADRFLGHRKAVLVGVASMMLGAGALAANLDVYTSIGLMLAGSGLFQPGVSAIVGNLYRRGDARRDAAFTWIYAAVNAGALAAGPAMGWVASSLGQGVAFALVAVGMLMLGGAFAAAQRLLPAEGYPGGEAAAPPAQLTGKDARDVALGTLGVAVLVVAAIALGKLVSPVWVPLHLGVKAVAVLALVAIVAGVERARAAGQPRIAIEAWHRIAVLVILGVFVAVFWASVGLAWSAVHLALDTSDTWWFYILNPVFVLIFAPGLALAHRRLDDGTPRAFSSLTKVAAGLVLGGASVALLLLGAGQMGLIGGSLLGAVAELFVAPIALSLVTQLAPPRSVAIALGAFSGVTLLGSAASSALLSPLMLGRGVSVTFALVIGGCTAAAGLLLLLLTPALKRWMHGAEDPEPEREAGATPYRRAGEVPPSAVDEASAPDESVHARRMITGALWALGGIGVTVASFSAASNGGQYVVAYGAIIYGVITFARGLAGASGARK